MLVAPEADHENCEVAPGRTAAGGDGQHVNARFGAPNNVGQIYASKYFGINLTKRL